MTALTSGTPTLTVDADTKFQQITGFGGTFNEMGWDALSVLDAAEVTRALTLLFDAKDGANFVYGRVPLGASDYSMSWYTLAETAFSRAFFYDPNVVEARVLMTMIYMARGEKKKARAEIELLQKQFPNEAPLYFMKGVINRLDGNYDDSLKAFEKLSRLDPAARAVCAYNRARIFIYKREYDQALKEIERGEKSEPDHPMLKIFRSGVYYYRGDKQMAIDLMQKVLEEHPNMDGIRPLFAIYLAGSGRDEEARAQLSDGALALAKSDHDMAYWVGSTYSILGDKDLAFKWLNRAVKLGNQNKPHFEKDRSLDPLRDDPRFAELMAKVNNGD